MNAGATVGDLVLSSDDTQEDEDNDARERFVARFGWRVPATHLAAVIGTTAEAVREIRRHAPSVRRAQPLGFTELFAMWNGRAPQDEEWPQPVRYSEGYEWTGPEDVLLASLVGVIAPGEIAEVLSDRLRAVTGDRLAQRTPASILVRMQQVGLEATDVVGGITTSEAGRRVGSRPLVAHAIRTGALSTRRIGRLLVIPHDGFDAWRATLAQAPEGYVPLGSIRERLGISSDSKLPEFAKLGYIPTAMQVRTSAGATTQFGTWYVHKDVSDRLVADRAAGRPMPWHGKPLLGNLKQTWARWSKRRHPASCATCSSIWGGAGAPADFEAFCEAYPPLTLGAKRHLTAPWTPGLTFAQAAEACGVSVATVRRAAQFGMLSAEKHGENFYLSRTEVTRWAANDCRTAKSERSWISLEVARARFGFTMEELKAFIDAGVLPSKVGTNGPMRGITYVVRRKCGQLRETQGFSRAEAARRLGVTPAQLERLLEGADWRSGRGIPLATLLTLKKRMQSPGGHSIDEVARRLGSSAQWVRERIADGTVQLATSKWDPERQYLTEVMLERLRRVQFKALPAPLDGDGGWLRVAAAAAEAGVSSSLMQMWGNAGEVRRESASSGWHYQRESVRERARVYWEHQRRKRAVPPAWLIAERPPWLLALEGCQQ